MNRSRSIEYLRSVGIVAAWLVGILIVWRVVLSIDAVQRAGLVIEPFRSEAYPYGLPWIFVIDAGFLTALILLVLSLGHRLRDFAFVALPHVRSVGSSLRLLCILAAVIIGYFAYDEVIYAPLYWQDIGWIYKLAFWLLVAGVSLLVLLQLGRAWYELDNSAPGFVRATARLMRGDPAPKASGVIILRPRAEATPSPPSEPAPDQQPPPEKRCSQCQAVLLKDARFCIKCGQEVPDEIPFLKRN